MIHWTGRSTNGTWKRTATADTFIELFHKCEENGTISNYDEDVWDKAVLEKNGKTFDDAEFQDEDGELDYNKVQNFIDNQGEGLTDKEIWNLIADQQGNAYYQTFQVDDNGEIRDIEESDFETEGAFKL